MTQAVATDAARVVARIVGLAIASGVLGVGVGVLHRWYARDRVPEGLTVLVGLAGVALYLNTTAALGQVIGGDTNLLGVSDALTNVAIFVAATVAASAGGRVGDRVAASLAVETGDGERDVGRLVRSVGRVVVVELPDEVGDIDGYDPVAPAVKDQLAGRTFTFPRRLTVAQLRDRLVDRLRTDHGVGHVDVELTEDGEVEYLAVGSREAGIGPSLPPATVAVPVYADPASDASPGDVVQVWRDDGGDPARVLTAEVRGTAGDVVTLAVDEDDASLLDPAVGYRLVTLPVETRADREFASLLRAAEETMAVVSVAAGSDVDGAAVGDLDVAVVAVRPADGPVEALPPRSRVLAPDESVYAVARPDRLRRLERAAGAAADERTVPGG